MTASRECKDCKHAIPADTGIHEPWDFAKCHNPKLDRNADGGPRWCKTQRLHVGDALTEEHCHPEGRYFEIRPASEPSPEPKEEMRPGAVALGRALFGDDDEPKPLVGPSTGKPHRRPPRGGNWGLFGGRDGEYFPLPDRGTGPLFPGEGE